MAALGLHLCSERETRRPGGEIVIVAAVGSSTASMGFGYIRRRCTSKAKHSSAISFGRERDRPVCFSIRRNRWRTVFGWQISTSAAPRTDVSLSCHTRNVSKSISRSSSGRSPKRSNATATVWTITSTPTRVRIAGHRDLGSLTGAIVARNPLGNRPVHRRTG